MKKKWEGKNLKKEELIKIFKNMEIKEFYIDEMMKDHTSFKIGGPADILFIPHSEEEILKVLKTCREKNIEYFIMGNGTNLLVRDGGIRGVVIKIYEKFSDEIIEENKIYVQSGALLTGVSRRAMAESLTGLEFANGIPGTIGGAVAMNAGAYGGEMKDIVKKVRVLDKDNNIIEYNNEEMNFRYRNSRVTDEGLIVLGVELELEFGDYETIKETMRDLTYRRTSRQPLELPSGGSTFKRPEGYYAGKLIDDSKLRGFKYGGAQVSEKHCGFVVNIDNASCEDVLGLIESVKEKVKNIHGVDLEPEIKIIGEDK